MQASGDRIATAEDFEPHRAFLRRLAYRMLGTQSEADDIVQDAWLRWHGTDRLAVAQPRAFLAKTVTRLCLDRLKSAQAQREVYFGPWLPEPVTDADELIDDSLEAAGDLAADLSYAFLLALERLSPLERAAFLLHDIFELDFAEIAASLERSPAACRQLASRARDKLRVARPRFASTPADGQRLAAAFMAASRSGDLASLKNLLAEDARLLSDGGRRVAAIGIPILGAARIIKVMPAMLRKHEPAGVQDEPLRINGLPGLLIRAADGAPLQTMAFEFDAEARIAAIYILRNPDKLQRFLR